MTVWEKNIRIEEKQTALSFAHTDPIGFVKTVWGIRLAGVLADTGLDSTQPPVEPVSYQNALADLECSYGDPRRSRP